MLNIAVTHPDLKGNKSEPSEFAQETDDYHCQLDG